MSILVVKYNLIVAPKYIPNPEYPNQEIIISKRDKENFQLYIYTYIHV